MKGFVKIDREDMAFYLPKDKEFSKSEAWIYLIMDANIEDREVLLAGENVLIKRGELIKSLRSLATTWRWKIGRVRRFLEQAQQRNTLRHAGGTAATHITICNYDSYEGQRHSNGKQTGTATEHFAAPPKERRKKNKIKTLLSTAEKAVDESEGLFFKMAKSFHELFTLTWGKNRTLAKADYGRWVRAARLMVEVDGVTREELLDVYAYLQSAEGNFWINTVMSMEGLRGNWDRINHAAKSCMSK